VQPHHEPIAQSLFDSSSVRQSYNYPHNMPEDGQHKPKISSKNMAKALWNNIRRRPKKLRIDNESAPPNDTSQEGERSARERVVLISSNLADGMLLT
jgi:hypothetical protein